MCPKCRSKNARRSYPKLWDFPFLVLQARPMRCKICDYRYYQWPWMSSSDTVKPVSEPPKLTAFKPLRKRSATASGKS
jgi:hypothetical protein